MPLEIEAKIKVSELQTFRARLEMHGAKFESRVLEKNLFFDTPSSALRLTDRGLRVRSAKDETDQSESCKITFKGPRQPGKFKNREERELKAEDAEKAADLLDAIGFRRTLGFEKKRETWTLRDCEVELDELPHIGFFVEVEGPNEQSIHAVRELLGLADAPLTDMSYIGLIAKHLRDTGQCQTFIGFE